MKRDYDTAALHRHQAALCDAILIARDFLGQWSDSFTRTNRDDIGLRSAMLAARGWGMLRDKSRFPAYVRTITRRQRAQAVRDKMRRKSAGFESDFDLYEEDLEEPQPELHFYTVAGASVSQPELVGMLPSALGRLSSLNQCLLLSFHEGFSCAELAERFDLTVENVKVRIHRSRQRVKNILEVRTRDGVAAEERRRRRSRDKRHLGHGIGPWPRKEASNQDRRRKGARRCRN